jgi:hypothetical protein
MVLSGAWISALVFNLPLWVDHVPLLEWYPSHVWGHRNHQWEQMGATPNAAKKQRPGSW